MRLVLLSLALLGAAASAHADPARETRYGPRTPRQEAVARPAYAGPILGWSGKRDAGVAATAAAAPSSRPQPMAAWARYDVAPAPAARPAATLEAHPARIPVAAPVAPSAPPVPTPTPITTLPDSLYSVPPAPPAAAGPVRPVPTSLSGGLGPRVYSVGRQYGMTPDSLPQPEPGRMVLIEAAAPAPQAPGGEQVHGSAEWLAAAANDDAEETRSPS